MKGITVGYTGWFGWPAVYCRILEIDGDRLRVELLEGGEGWIRATDFTPKYFFKLAPETQADTAEQALIKVMSTPPAWAPDLPVACESGKATNYGDA